MNRNQKNQKAPVQHRLVPYRTIVTAIFAVIGAVIFGLYGRATLSYIYINAFHGTPKDDPYGTKANFLIWVPLSVFGGIAGGFLGGKLVNLVNRVDKMDRGDKVTLVVGIFLGLVASVPFLTLFQSVEIVAIRNALTISVMIGACAIVTYLLTSMSDSLPWYKGQSRARRTGIKVLDTNVIIDGRIHDVVKTGFLEGRLYVPQFVLEELQYIADSHDALKRQRGRRGLEVLRHMQNDYELQVGVYDRYAPDATEEVDARLVRLAKAVGGDIVTNDFNLNRVAALQDVKVLSLNDLALSLRTNILPEESMVLKIIREGNQIGQGVGYLEDGTMVVVENGQAHIGETTHVVVSQVIQTERGKIIFAEVEGRDNNDTRRRGPGRRPN